MIGVFHLKMSVLMTLVGNKFYHLLVGVLGLLFASCSLDSSRSNFIEISGFAQGTTFKIIYEDSLNRDLSSEIDSILRDFDNELSLYIDSSELSKFNKATNHYYLSNQSNYIKNCFQYSKSIYQLSNGAFNPAIYPLIKYWGFSNHVYNDSISQSTIDSLLVLVSFADSSFYYVDSDSTFQIPPFFYKINSNSQLDFNAIAQGYSVDVLGDFLSSFGCVNYMVEIGGEVVTSGLNPDKSNWKIGIDQPIEHSIPGENDFQCVVTLQNKALATSGNYRKFYKKEGVKYSHTIDPSTGYPVNHSLLSVSVIADKAYSADGYATAFMVMGVDKSIDFIDANPNLGLEAYFVLGSDDGNKIKMTKGMNRYLVN